MSSYLRLRQICLATDNMPGSMADLAAIFGVRLAHEDPAVAAYGVCNAVFPFGLSFIELVAPLRADTAASRFVQLGAGRGAYMAIFNCDNPRQRRDRIRALGLRIAAEIELEDFHAIQLHPRDCRATMIEFDCTLGEEDLRGSYFAAGGSGWTDAIRTDVTQAISAVLIESPTPWALCEHWATILDRPARSEAAGGTIDVDLCRIDFRRGPVEALTTVAVYVADIACVLGRAAERGFAIRSNEIVGVCGVNVSLHRAGRWARSGRGPVPEGSGALRASTLIQ